MLWINRPTSLTFDDDDDDGDDDDDNFDDDDDDDVGDDVIIDINQVTQLLALPEH